MKTCCFQNRPQIEHMNMPNGKLGTVTFVFTSKQFIQAHATTSRYLYNHDENTEQAQQPGPV